MAILLRIPAAILLGLYSSAGLHYYSVWSSRQKSDAVRFLIFVAAIALFIIGPLVPCTFLSSRIFKHVRGNLPVILTLCWLGVVLLYLTLNWRGFDQRLRGLKGQDGAAGK